MNVVAGVDAGGSSTVAAVARADSPEPLATRVGAPSPLRPSTTITAATTIAATVRTALAAVPGAILRRLVVGAAGAGRESERSRLQAALQAEFPCEVSVFTDAEIAHRAAFHGMPGVLLIVGTGAIALARDTRGAWHRVGGYGPAFADEIGGFNIGRSALAAIGQAYDGRGPATALTDAAFRMKGLAGFDDLVAWASDASPDQIATLAEAVNRAASGGDEVARAIVREATVHLLGYVARAIQLSELSEPRLAMAGGLVQEASDLRVALTAAAETHFSDVYVLPDIISPIQGALELAVSG